MLDLVKFWFDVGGIWFLLFILIVVALLAVTVLGIVNPCAFAHLDAFLGQSFCDICGIQLRPYCPVCLISHHPAAVFCDECGAVLVEVSGDD